MENNFYELTNPQKSIWNTELFFENTTINNICAGITILEKTDEKILEKAINNIVEKNDAFRIQISIKNNSPVQTITDFKQFKVKTDYIKNEKELEEIKNEVINYKFNILNSPLFYFRIAILENGQGELIFTVNHIIADSWSLGLFGKNVMKEYFSLKNNSVLEEENYSYTEYINSELEYKKSKKYELDKAYWEDSFKTIPEQASFPCNKKIDTTVSCEASRETFLLNTEFTKKINDFCSNYKISVFNFFMAIYSIYIGRVSRLDDFVIGTPILNRTNFKEKQTMGMFINTMPIRINISENKSFTEFAKNLSSNIMSNLKHQRYSYNRNIRRFKRKR